MEHFLLENSSTLRGPINFTKFCLSGPNFFKTDFSRFLHALADFDRFVWKRLKFCFVWTKVIYCNFIEEILQSTKHSNKHKTIKTEHQFMVYFSWCDMI